MILLIDRIEPKTPFPGMASGSLKIECLGIDAAQKPDLTKCL